MPKHNKYYATVEGKRVCYTTTQRGGFWGVRFRDNNNKRLERMTRCPVRGKHAPDDFHNEAAKIIQDAISVLKVSNKQGIVSFADALDKVEATSTDLRPDTLIAYRKACRILQATLEAENIKVTSPSEVTSQLATLFARCWLAGTFTRSTASDAKHFKRKPTTLAFYLRQLSAVWQQFSECGFVTDNPWKAVRKPQVDKVRKPVPSEDDVTEFFKWIHTRYPEWHRLHALLNLKAISGCRSQDLCQLRTEQLRNGRVEWTAAQTKQREGRSVKLPEELFKQLQQLAGSVWLWEGFSADAAKFRPSRIKMPEGYSAKSVAGVVSNLFREFGEEQPNRKHLTPHALRRRAITLTVTATQSVDATAQAIGLNPATARRYYLDSQRAFDTDAIFDKLATKLMPQQQQQQQPPA